MNAMADADRRFIETLNTTVLRYIASNNRLKRFIKDYITDYNKSVIEGKQNFDNVSYFTEMIDKIVTDVKKEFIRDLDSIEIHEGDSESNSYAPPGIDKFKLIRNGKDLNLRIKNTMDDIRKDIIKILRNNLNFDKSEKLDKLKEVIEDQKVGAQLGLLENSNYNDWNNLSLSGGNRYIYIDREITPTNFKNFYTNILDNNWIKRLINTNFSLNRTTNRRFNLNTATNFLNNDYDNILNNIHIYLNNGANNVELRNYLTEPGAGALAPGNISINRKLNEKVYFEKMERLNSLRKIQDKFLNSSYFERNEYREIIEICKKYINNISFDEISNSTNKKHFLYNLYVICYYIQAVNEDTQKMYLLKEKDREEESKKMLYIPSQYVMDMRGQVVITANEQENDGHGGYQPIGVDPYDFLTFNQVKGRKKKYFSIFKY